MTSSKPCAIPATVNSNTLTIAMSATGISNVTGSEVELSLAPNPNNGRFVLSALWDQAMSGKSVQLEILNAVGQAIYKDALKVQTSKWQRELSLPEATPAGMYILKLNTGNGQITRRFTINR